MLRRLRSRLFTRFGLCAVLATALVGALTLPQAWAWYHLRSAEAALAAYHPEQARESLSSCARVWGNRPGVHLLASRAARQAGDLTTAERELRECERLLGSATEETAFEWALLQTTAGNVREFEEYLQRRAESSSEAGPLVWESLVEGYLRVYRSLDAMACVNHWLKRDPDNVRALELRGQTYVTGKGVVRGADDYRRVLQLDPTRKLTRWRLIGCLLELGSYEEAAEHLELFGRQTPDDPEVPARLARCYVMMKRGDDARRLLDAAMARHPDNGPCLRARGQVALTHDPPEFAEAEEYLRRAVVALPNDYQTRWSYAESLRQQGKTAEARAQIVKAEELRDRLERLGELRSRKLAEQPLDPTLHYEMGVLLVRTGHLDVGERWFVSALSLDPDHKPSHAALADVYDRMGDKPRADEHRKKATAEK